MTIRRLLLATLPALLVVPAAAPASFPGRNGKLAATVAGCQTARGIVAITPGTPGTRQLTPRCERSPGERSAYRDTFAPEWFPDGRRLLFVEAPPAPQENAASTLRTVGAGGGGGQRLFELPMDTGMGAPGVTLSPDGERVVWARKGGVFTARLDGSDVRVLRRERRCVDSEGKVHPEECDFVERPRWSPDGRYLAVMRSGGAVAARAGIWLMDARTGRLIRRLSPGGRDAEWSPDSRRIAFASHYGRGEDGDVSGGNIYTVGVDGFELRRVVRGHGTAETQPAWSPDGRWIAWVKLRFGPGDVGFRVTPSVWRQRVAGGRQDKLATLPEPYVDETFFAPPDLAWQPLP